VRQGVLTPQDLVRPGWALIVDLARSELRYEPEAEALGRLAADSAAPLRQLEFRHCFNDGLFDLTHRVISASINGVATSLLIDTGASRTSVAWSNPVLGTLLPGRTWHDDTIALTSARETALLPGVRVDVAQSRFVVSVLVLPARQFCGEGLLGADILDSCTLVWGWDSLWAACRPAG
jgi:hypothetical protein